MRGQVKEAKSLILTGKVYLDIEEDTNIANAFKGDVLLYLFLESVNTDPLIAYYKKGYKGYFKAKIYDGYVWCQIDYFDFFENKENYFSKNEISIHVFDLCKEIIEKEAGIPVFRSYRSHYTKHKYESTAPFKGKKGHFNRKNLIKVD
jgi:hypothetical protein